MPYYGLYPRRNTGPYPDEEALEGLAASSPSPVNQFATIAGLAAQAISPNTWGGRLGGNVAGLAMRNEQMAAPYNQLLFQSRLAARAEQARQRKLQGLLGRLGTPTSRLSVQGDEPQAPGAEPSAFGVPPVTTSLVEGERTGYPEITPEDYAGFTELLGPQGAQGMMGLLARTGRVPLTPGERAAGFKPTSAGGSQFNAVTGQYEGGQAPMTNVQAQVRPGSSLPPSVAYPQGYTAPFDPRAYVPEATGRTQSRPAYRLGDVDYPAVENVFSPQEMAVIGTPGSGIIPQPGAPMINVPLAPRQGAILKPGERGPFGVEGVTPQEPVYSPAQQAAPAAGKRGLTRVRPGEVVLDPSGNVIYRAESSPLKAGKTTGRDKDVAVLAERFMGMTDEDIEAFIESVPSTLKTKAMEAKQIKFNARRAEIQAGVGGRSTLGRIAVNPETKQRLINRDDGRGWVPYAQ